MSRQRIALVGAGVMGSHHARVISQSPSADLVALVDPSPDTGRLVAERYGARWSPELPDLDDVDGVVVAAPTEYHRRIALDVLESGTPLLIEKPVAADLGVTREILAVADGRDIPLMCGFLERFNPAVLTAASIVEAPVHLTAVRHSPYAPRIRTGVGWDLLVHDVDLALRFLGDEPSRVRSSLGHFHPTSGSDSEDVAEAVLSYADGGVAHVSASRVGQRKIRQLSIYELDRLVEVDLLRRDVTVYRHVSENSADGEGRGYRQQTVIEIPEMLTSQEPLTAQFEKFLSLAAGQGDASAERASVLPAHVVVDQVISGGLG
ncbi:Gfo/Idh/MocA family protein [Frigoribacterium sp. VKM Ac-2836]|uniref:Gfo/Idh/MocA family protein n=1 Tax=Frigoribacterium sp. VKM Ac-2836 TaxID=2739014 RepID=UPI0015652472|nr:Gfo/Idh/MocA family oxidoreductase [Frigoribacterium sp. VKM Ac-2836]NRD25418.1 Gfo/Idh/MocA family oxidoreductase [Frigoribacterium sp. VKM Ac-2836]